MFAMLLLVAVAGVFVYNAVVAWQTPGTMAERLSAAWKGSMTIFTIVMATLVQYLTVGMDKLAEATGQPEFASFAKGVTGLLTPGVQTYIAAALPVVTMGLVIWARLRTAGK